MMERLNIINLKEMDERSLKIKAYMKDNLKKEKEMVLEECVIKIKNFTLENGKMIKKVGLEYIST